MEIYARVNFCTLQILNYILNCILYLRFWDSLHRTTHKKSIFAYLNFCACCFEPEKGKKNVAGKSFKNTIKVQVNFCDDFISRIENCCRICGHLISQKMENLPLLSMWNIQFPGNLISQIWVFIEICKIKCPQK